jgi:hypothetical protein
MSGERIGLGAMPGGDGVGEFAPLRRRRWPLWLSFSLSGCAFAGLVLVQSHGQGLVAMRTSPSFSRVAFIETDQLPPMLSFSPPDAGRGQPRYLARVRDGTGERRDTLTYGELGADDLFFRVTVHSVKSAPARPSLFVELAKQSAELGAAVVRATSPEFYATARGPVEWTGMTLTGPNGERSCLGFRFARAAEVELSGLACEGRDSLDPVALGCLIDRLSATSAGLEAGLGEALRSDSGRAAVCRRVAG